MSEPQAIPTKTSLRRKVHEYLRAEDSRSMAGSLGLFLTGLGVCFVVGLAVATVLTLTTGFLKNYVPINWFGWFLVYWVVLVPLLIWQERRSRTDYLVGALTDVSPNPSSRGEYEMDRARVGVAAYATMITWGPRALLDGVSGLRGRWTVKQNHMFNRAAAIVLDLAKFDGGIEFRDVMHPPENMALFTAAMDWLEKNDWTGKSSDGQRVWLTSIGKKKLMDRNMMPERSFKEL
jgi:hypothetical protein